VLAGPCLFRSGVTIVTEVHHRAQNTLFTSPRSPQLVFLHVLRLKNCAFLIALLRATSLAHLIHNLVVILIFGEKFRFEVSVFNNNENLLSDRLWVFECLV
jgi:hypothetical protein